jgi:hypothetical protein
VTLIALMFFVLALLPADAALAARSWQPAISAPAGFSFGGFGPAVQLDSRGNLSTTLKPNGAGPYQYGVRPRAGALGAPLAFPGTLGEAAITTRLTAQNAAGDLLMWNSAGNIVGFRPAPIYSAAFDATTFANVQSLPSEVGGIKYAFMTPTGETFAQTLEGDPKAVNPTSKTYVIFRPAGPNSAFDESQKIELPPAATDTATEPLGIVADPNGRVTAVYRSRPSRAVIQISAAPGGDFEDPEELALTEDPAKWQETALPKIATSYDGHAILAWGTDRTKVVGYRSEIWASRRAPGGTFGPRELVADLDPGHYETDADSDYGPTGVFGNTGSEAFFPVALDSGATLVGFNDVTEGDPCNDPLTADSANGAQLAVKDGGAWSLTPLGANGNVNYSTLDAIAGAGNSVALTYYEGTRAAPCSSSVSSTLSAKVGTASNLGSPVALTNAGGSLGTGIAVNPAGDAALLVDSPRVLRVYEDPGATPEEPGNPGNPSNPGGGSSGSGSGGSGSGTLPIGTGPPPPAKVVAPGGIKLDKPLVVDQRGRQRWFNFSIFCVTTVQVTCTVTATPLPGSSRPFARPASALAAKKKPLIKPSSGKVAPGKTKELKTYLTPAGIALLNQKGSFKTKVKVVVKSGAAESSEVKTITVQQG